MSNELEMISVVKTWAIFKVHSGTAAKRGVCGMEMSLRRIHCGDLHKAHTEDRKTTYYTALLWRLGNTGHVSTKLSRVVRCGFIALIFLFVQVQLNMGGANTWPHITHRETRIQKCLVYNALYNVVYMRTLQWFTATHVHRTHTANHFLTLLPLSGVQQSDTCVPPFASLLIVGCSLSHLARLAQEPLAEQPHRWLAGLLPKQKPDLKARTCEGVTLQCKPHSNTHKRWDNSPGHMKAGGGGPSAR